MTRAGRIPSIPGGERTDGRKVLSRVLVGLLGLAAVLAGLGTNRLLGDMLIALMGGCIVFLVLVALLKSMGVGCDQSHR